MSNQSCQNSTPGQRSGNAARGADSADQLDEDALRAFVNAAETGTLDDCDSGTVSAAARAVRALLDSDDTASSKTTDSDQPPTVPAERKWAEAAGCDASEASTTAATAGEAATNRQSTATAGSTTATTGTETGESPTTAPVGSAQPIDRGLLPDHVEVSAAKSAYEAVLAFLVGSGPATKREIVTTVMPRHPLGYAPPADRGSVSDWWTEVIEPGLETDPTVSYRPDAGYAVGDWLR
ncbi:MAG: hypothetical protein ABEH61_04875 [Haloarculaceae archaeon]